MMVVYHLQKCSGKSGSSQNILRSNGTSKKEVLSFRMEYSKQKFVPFLQSCLWCQFQAFAVIFQWMELICSNGKRNSDIKFTSPEFVYHLLKQWTDWFAHVNGKQPMF